MMKGIYLGLVFFLLLIIAMIHWYVKERRVKQGYETFYSTNICGRVWSVRSVQGMVYLKVVGDTSNTYMFLPHTSEANNNKIFRDEVGLGDSICKPAYHDTIYIYSGKEVLKYDFMRYE